MSQHNVVVSGAPLEEARGAVVMIHGRGSSPQDILMLTSHFDPGDLAYLAPAAHGGVWYPERFMMPRHTNQPYLSQALDTVKTTIQMAESAGIARDKVVLLGFSQGACLVTEYAARNPMRYGGVVGLSGGLIGADDELTGYEGTLMSTPVFLGCSDVDFHIPVERVHYTATVFEQLGGTVTKQIYPNFGHSVNMDEIEHIRGILQAL